MTAAATNGYAAKRTLIDRLKEVSRLGQGALGQANVNYEWRGETSSLLEVFGGVVNFTHPGDTDDVAEGTLVKEIALISLHIRALINPTPVDGLRTVEELIEEVADQVAALIAADRHIAGGHSLARIADGFGDQEDVPDGECARLTMHIAVESYVEFE